MSGISGFFERNGCRLCTRIVADANVVALPMDFGVKFREMTGYEVKLGEIEKLNFFIYFL